MVRPETDILHLLWLKLCGSHSIFKGFLLLPESHEYEDSEKDDQQQEEIYNSVFLFFLCFHRCLYGTSRLYVLSMNHFNGFCQSCPENTKCSQIFQVLSVQIVFKVYKTEEEGKDLACQKPPQVSFDSDGRNQEEHACDSDT